MKKDFGQHLIEKYNDDCAPHNNTVHVQRMCRFDNDRPLKAFVDIVVNDVLLVKGVRVMSGTFGLFVSMPREKSQGNHWYDTIRCLTQEFRDQITECVLKAYREE